MDNLKERFFAQYWGVECGAYEFNRRIGIFNVGIEVDIFKIEYLKLKSIESITDDDHEYVTNHIGDGEYGEAFAFEFLRSLGYLVPFMGMSEDELVKKGWVKIVE